jgi:nitrogenase subunit NifH
MGSGSPVSGLRIAVYGKGGSGKSTLAAGLSSCR